MILSLILNVSNYIGCVEKKRFFKFSIVDLVMFDYLLGNC